MANLINIGASGISTYQNALTITGNNISKANVPGYSRQEAILSSQPAQLDGAGYIGSGVINDGVIRLADQFLIDQLRMDTAAFERLDTFLNNVEQIDSLLADPSTGLSTGMESFFASIQSGTEDPAAIPNRQLILIEGQGLVDRFHTLDERFRDQNDIINQQLGSMADQISSIAQGISGLNQAIAQAKGTGLGNQPNDLLDQRDEMLRQLAELVAIKTVEQDDGVMNVFIGNGQPLVIGTEYNNLSAQEGQTDPFRFDLGFVQGTLFQSVSQDLNGGQLGGLLDFRREVLDPAFNELGRIALAIADNINTQQNRGLDLEGNFGTDFFKDINAEALIYNRVSPHNNNAQPDDRVLSITIEDVSELSSSDYGLKFESDTTYTITRSSDDTVVNQGFVAGVFPLSIEVEGFNVNLISGSFQQGDRFILQPTRDAASNIDTAITRTQEIAFASPILTNTSLGNIGNGIISQGEVLDIYQSDGTTLLDTFVTPGQLTPPILIRFTSETSYDVLDVTDPANPVNLSPPMINQTFVPGLVNDVFTRDPNQTAVFSNGLLNNTVTPGTGNGYPAETITIAQTDPDTGIVTNQSIILPAGSSANASAVLLSQLDGVSAVGDTSAVLTINDVDASAMQILLNGIDITDPALGSVDSPLTADFLRDRINSSALLNQQGIIATSDGIGTTASLSVRSTTGQDLIFEMPVGGGADALTITDANGGITGAPPILPTGVATVGGLLRVEMADSGRLTSSTGRFSVAPMPLNTFVGYQVSLTGTPVASDEFTIGFNNDGVSDNRNAIALAALATAGTMQNGNLSYQESYAQFVEFVGTTTSQTRINQEASESLLRQSQANRDSLSGVNLDEEAARLIQFEQAYNASAQVISIARQIFDSLLAAF